jgi:Lar family restriction alleviation protein
MIKLTEELKPCPCCGNNAHMKQLTSGIFKKTTVFYVECYMCKLHTSVELEVYEAERKWNNRRASDGSSD